MLRKKILLSAAITMFSLPNPVFSTDTIYGPAGLCDAKGKSLNVYGPAKLDKVEYSAKLTVYGPLHIKASKVQDIDVFGPLKGQDLKVSTVNVKGPMKLEKSDIQTLDVMGPFTIFDTSLGAVKVSADKVNMTSSKVKTLLVRKNDNEPDKVQKVFLKGTTEVPDIKFESGKGIVIVIGDKVKTAKIVGGTIQNREEKHKDSKADDMDEDDMKDDVKTDKVSVPATPTANVTAKTTTVPAPKKAS